MNYGVCVNYKLIGGSILFHNRLMCSLWNKSVLGTTCIIRNTKNLGFHSPETKYILSGDLYVSTKFSFELGVCK